MISVKNIPLLLIVIGLVLLVIHTNESFEQTGSVGYSCQGNKFGLGSTDCLSGLYCVNNSNQLVQPSEAGTCQKCSNTDVGTGYIPLVNRGTMCSRT
jgi:hypothetical protein